MERDGITGEDFDKINDIHYDDYKNQSKLYALAVARKDKLVSFLREKNYENVKNKPNITLYDGTASFLSENTIRIVSGKDETWNRWLKWQVSLMR